jgi:hypothetical protein
VLETHFSDNDGGGCYFGHTLHPEGRCVDTGALDRRAPGYWNFLVLFGLARLRGEIELLDKVKAKHRELLQHNYGLSYPEIPTKVNRHFRGFKNHVTWYLVSLGVLGLVNVFGYLV